MTRLCSADTMAAAFEVSASTWWKWAADGVVGPGYQVGGSRRWDLAEEVERVKARSAPRVEQDDDPIMRAVKRQKECV